LRKVMLLAAMLAMVLAAAVPALAQTVTQVGNGNVACVQNAAQASSVNQTIAQANQYGDNNAANGNVTIQTIAQECNITVAQVNTIVEQEDIDIVVATASATASASATAAPSHVQYNAPAAVQYQYSSASAAPAAAAAAELPSTGGSSLIALGAGVLLVAGGLLARRIVR